MISFAELTLALLILLFMTVAVIIPVVSYRWGKTSIAPVPRHFGKHRSRR